ncbi:hypothetical protein [Okeania sp. SIO2B3]|uniref:hypothetical protein n=1 Tax=Okeania sp. SIO2B3 TaxID=2607784 RepID=UPI0013BF7A2B|nr:hypothetical protein [Okeania sp. SIO2B3]NET46716.1 hypothetical protein [Okeania sp. SIO2B3]
MKKIFSKDDVAPDAMSIVEFKLENKIEASNNLPFISISYEDWVKVYFVGENDKYYVEYYSCGVYEYLYLFEDRESYIENLTKSLIYCNLLR